MDGKRRFRHHKIRAKEQGKKGTFRTLEVPGNIVYYLEEYAKLRGISFEEAALDILSTKASARLHKHLVQVPSLQA